MTTTLTLATTLSGFELVAQLIKLCRRHWPVCTVQFTDQVDHFFVYQDSAVAAQQSTRGICGSGLRVYFTSARDGQFTVKTDGEDYGSTTPIIEALRRSFTDPGAWRMNP